MNGTDLFGLLEWLQLVVFGGLAVAAIGQWRRRRDEAGAWLALTFGSLGAVVLIGRLIPEDSTAIWATITSKILVLVVVLFPYLLYRFMISFVPRVGWFFNLATILTIITATMALFVDLSGPNEPRTTMQQGFIFLLLTQWIVLSARVAYRLWTEGGKQPMLACRRMRTLSLGSIGMALAIVLSGSSAPPDPGEADAVRIAIQVLALISGPFFLLGFAPPRIVRMWWRQAEGLRFREAEAGLVEASTPDEVASVLLPHVCRFVGGAGAALLGSDARIIGYDGMTKQEAEELAASIADAEDLEAARDTYPKTLVVRMGSGALAVRSSPLSPFFGEEEGDMMRRLALLADLALARAELFQKAKESHEQLQEAQRIASIGSWEWEVSTGAVEWSDELYRIYGIEPGSFQPDLDSSLQHIHPDDIDRVIKTIRSAVEAKGSCEFEHRLVRASGETRVLAARGKTVLDRHGEIVKMIGISQDITERKKEEVIRETFIANAAHELRTPLTSLLGFVDVIAKRNDDLSPEQREQAVEVMERSGARLAALVDNLLDLTKLQQGQLEIVPEPMDVGEVCQDIVRSDPVASGKNVTVDVPMGLIVRADKHRMYQVLRNLLTNAYRYGGDNIAVEGEARNGSVVVSVSDDGPGVEPNLAERMFEPFARGAASAGVGGSGLGLAIVKMLVEASGGEIWYEPAEPAGARFAIRLEPVDE